jgi:hypothetical protein
VPKDQVERSSASLTEDYFYLNHRYAPSLTILSAESL